MLLGISTTNLVNKRAATVVEFASLLTAHITSFIWCSNTLESLTRGWINSQRLEFAGLAWRRALQQLSYINSPSSLDACTAMNIKVIGLQLTVKMPHTFRITKYVWA